MIGIAGSTGFIGSRLGEVLAVSGSTWVACHGMRGAFQAPGLQILAILRR